MSVDPTSDYLVSLVTELRKLPMETGWVEFKVNMARDEDIGEYISALSNSAALHGQPHAYVVWGIEDGTHNAVGTQFSPDSAKVGNEALQSWLVRSLSPRLYFRFFRFKYAEVPVVVLEIPSAAGRPTQFKGVEYIRIGSHRQALKDHPQIEAQLWRVFDVTPFERVISLERVTDDNVLALLDYPAYFDLVSLPLPSGRKGILARLTEDRLIIANRAEGWDITSLGAILFAKNLEQFGPLARKAVRVIVYQGPGRLVSEPEYISPRGYASGFEALIDRINARLPSNEVIGRALRRDVPMYPELAIRELVANALIHQDFSISGAGPMIEIFDDRMEITNPGEPLVDVRRFLDLPPRSRNETLAALMRRIGICEERGSGIDKVVSQTEIFQLPAPSFEHLPGSTRAVLFGHRPLNSMDKVDKVRACYLHACLRFVQRDTMTNSSLRERFAIPAHNLAIASRIIRDTMEDGLVRPYDPEQGRKHARYVPFWA